MDTSTIWWLLAGSAVVLELLTGTFYLLMLALGLAAGALVSHAGYSAGWQYLAAALVGGGAVLMWHFKQVKSTTASSTETQSNQDVHIDIGSSVEVKTWSASGTGRAFHRGADWSVRRSQSGLRGSEHFETGLHRIVAVEGNTLVLEKS